ncbi:hypothetical protein [Noviherbaspirillum pedocola]|uniref:Uncharacterized protein n=1 Tax=Noviherbaspirillum pedocola TaxID=2801341 RepID=A0A934SUW7_9BURK|nr:hypothetical protein [Noviherbaspirillum pedocola]MBK4736024.1 hypothetical protein [Noviherbaspirillum pedocola]
MKPMTHEKRLLRDLARDAHLLPQLLRIWRTHPLLQQISCRMAEYISLYPQDGDGHPLMQTALIGAISEYERCCRQTDSTAACDAYTRALIGTAEQVFSQEICADIENGTVRWMPLEESATAFLQKHPNATVHVMRCPRWLSRRMAICAIILQTVPHALLDAIASDTIFDELCGTA